MDPLLQAVMAPWERFRTLGAETIDAFVAPSWLFAIAVLILFAWRVSRIASPRDRPPQVALSATLVTIATIVGATTILGACGVLKPWLLLTSVSTVSLVGLALIGSLSGRGDAEPGLASAAGRDELKQPRPDKLVDRWWWIGWLLLFACLAGHVVVNGLGAFPTEFDGLAYHIPLIDHWLQSQSLYTQDAPLWWMPANAEVVGLWMVAPFSGDFLISLNNLPFIVLWSLATVEVGRLAGLSVGWRHLAALGVLAVHTTFHEAEKAMNDVAVAACFFAALAYGFRYLRSARRADLCWAGMALGLLAGVKYFALGYATLAFAVTVAAASLRMPWKDVAAAAAIVAATAVPFGSYWYLRNLWLTGAPLFPLGDVGPAYPNLWQTTFAGNRQAELVELTVRAFWKMTGPCHAAAACAAPVALVCLAWTGIAQLRRGKPQHGSVTLAMAALLAGTAAIVICTPFAVEDQPGTLNHLRWAYTPARYSLCFLGILVLAFVWLLERGVKQATNGFYRWSVAPARSLRWASNGAQLLFGGVLAFQWHQRLAYLDGHADPWGDPDLVSAALIGANVAACIWLAVEVYPWTLRHKAIAFTVAIVGAGAGVSLGAASLAKHWHEGFASHFDRLRGSRVFSHLTKATGPLRIAVLDPRPYPFFGSARQHRVFGPHRLTTYDELIRYLLARRPDVVASPRRNSGSEFDRFKEGPDWIAADEAHFRPLSPKGGNLLLFSFSAPSEHSSLPGGAASAPPGPAPALTAIVRNASEAVDGHARRRSSSNVNQQPRPTAAPKHRNRRATRLFDSRSVADEHNNERHKLRLPDNDS